MSATCNFVFNQSNGLAVVVYSHYGRERRHSDLASALRHARRRMGDHPYFVRMAVSYLIKDFILDEVGFGIHASEKNDVDFIYFPAITINVSDRTVVDDTGIYTIDEFIEKYAKTRV